MYKVKKPIVILCPKFASGGPELLHQLSNELNIIGRESYICYYPFEENINTHNRYLKYCVQKISAENVKNSFVIIPETATKYIKKFQDSKIIIYWLSIDNYFKETRSNPPRERVPIDNLKMFDHFVQSAYAEDFLKRHDIYSKILSDYLSEEHFCKVPPSPRINRILFNPKKGIQTTNRLKTIMSQYEFVPLTGFGSQKLVQIFQTSKVYIDFGDHPGKDRMPREAAIGGCCIVTNRRGSAGFFQDVPIDDRYKIDDERNDFESEAVRVIVDIMENFWIHDLNFLDYRDKILAERSIFSKQVREYF